jgi:Tfp pilus assembly protein PilF
MLRKIIITGNLFLTIFICHGQSNFSRGENYLMQNKPAEAVVFLESAIIDDPSYTVSYLYLGVVYEQLERVDEAIAVYRRVLPAAGSLSATVANNLGNVYFKKGNFEEAESYYSQSIGFDSVYSSSYLGRANTRIKTGNLKDAVTDYEQYLTLEPLSGQRHNIENLLAFIRAEFAAIEMRRQMAEEEERRLADERQNLLDSVSASLQSAADASKGISSGAESVEGYENEFVLE